MIFLVRGGKDMTEPEKLTERERNYMLASAIEMILGYISHHKSMDLAVRSYSIPYTIIIMHIIIIIIIVIIIIFPIITIILKLSSPSSSPSSPSSSLLSLSSSSSSPHFHQYGHYYYNMDKI
jgi:hypothetical protein